jgi:hypothetical protein
VEELELGRDAAHAGASKDRFALFREAKTEVWPPEQLEGAGAKATRETELGVTSTWGAGVELERDVEPRDHREARR